MFKPEGVRNLAGRHKNTFKRLTELRRTLAGRFPGLERAAAALVLAVASGEALLLIGPPGTAKSRLIRVLCHETGLIDDAELKDSTARDPNAESPERHQDYFEYLLTAFTEPGELFGFFDLAKLQKEHKLEREDTGMMQKARVVFLDEVFNASSAILNALLTFMNERKFHDRGKSVPVRLEYLLGATNEIPVRPELRALFDRFVLRCWVDNVPPDGAAVGRMLQAGWKETYDPPSYHGRPQFGGLLENVRKLRKSVEELSHQGKLAIDTDNKLFSVLADAQMTATALGSAKLSNRRLVRFAKIMLLNACMRWSESDATGQGTTPTIGSEDLLILAQYGLDDQPSADGVERFLKSLPL